MRHFHHRGLPDGSALLSGHSPRDDLGFPSDRLQILYRNTDEGWADPDVHSHQASDECFIVLKGSVTIEVEGQRVHIAAREFCFFPSGTAHALVDTEPPVEMLIIRAPSVNDKAYRALERSDWPDFLEDRETVTLPRVRRLAPDDRDWVEEFITSHWGADLMVVHGVSYRLSELPGFCALEDENAVGLVTYRIEGEACEIISLDSLRERQGIGSELLHEVEKAARDRGCSRLWLVTTNDNLNALRFYQRRGFVLAALHRDAVAAARQIKPEIPTIGDNGIAIRDEIELEKTL